MKKTKYKVYAGIRKNSFDLRRKLTILDTGADVNFVHFSAITKFMITLIKQGPDADIRDANDCPIPVTGAIDLCVKLCTHVNRDEFFACDRISAP